jgi:hypothetical protein
VGGPPADQSIIPIGVETMPSIHIILINIEGRDKNRFAVIFPK